MTDDDASPSDPPATAEPLTPGVEVDRISALVIARGAATGLLLAMPAAFANVVLADQTPKPRGAINLAFLVVFIGFGVAGWLAGREAPGQTARHGAYAALAAFLPVEIIAVLGRLDRGSPVTIFGIVFVGLLAACLGTMGAAVGARKNKGVTG